MHGSKHNIILQPKKNVSVIHIPQPSATLSNIKSFANSQEQTINSSNQVPLNFIPFFSTIFNKIYLSQDPQQTSYNLRKWACIKHSKYHKMGLPNHETKTSFWRSETHVKSFLSWYKTLNNNASPPLRKKKRVLKKQVLETKMNGKGSKKKVTKKMDKEFIFCTSYPPLRPWDNDETRSIKVQTMKRGGTETFLAEHMHTFILIFTAFNIGQIFHF